MFPAYHVSVTGCVCAVHENFPWAVQCWGVGVPVSRPAAAVCVVAVVLVPLAATQVLVAVLYCKYSLWQVQTAILFSIRLRCNV